MNKEETVKFIAFVRASYPSWNKDISKAELQAVIFSWLSHFADVPVNAMLMAFHTYQKENKFAPSIADIESELKTLSYVLEFEINNGDENPLKAGLLASLDNHLHHKMKADDAFLNLISNNNILGIEGKSNE